MNQKSAQQGRARIKEAILENPEGQPGGLINSEIADLLYPRSDCLGGQEDCLPWSMLGLSLTTSKSAATSAATLSTRTEYSLSKEFSFQKQWLIFLQKNNDLL
jgi:hypothetical protein